MFTSRTATILAATALAVAVFGSTPLGHAAGNLILARNSVGTVQLKKNAVTGPKLRKNAVTSVKVKNGTLLAADFKPGQLPAGPQGPPGAPGPQGPPGAPNPNAANAELLDGLDSTAFVGKSEGLAGSFGCAGSAWESVLSSTTYGVNGALKYRTGGQTAVFRCSVDIPHGATVTAARFTVAGEMPCWLVRTNMVSGIVEYMAAASSTASGPQRVVDFTIETPVIDNANYTYYVQCSVDGSDASEGVYGSNIAYTTTGANTA